jgi:hypothetical protein
MRALLALAAMASLLATSVGAQEPVELAETRHGWIGPNHVACTDPVAAFDLALLATENDAPAVIATLREKLATGMCTIVPYPMQYIRTLRIYHSLGNKVRLAEAFCPDMPGLKFYLALPSMPTGVYEI